MKIEDIKADWMQSFLQILDSRLLQYYERLAAEGKVSKATFVDLLPTLADGIWFAAAEALKATCEFPQEESFEEKWVREFEQKRKEKPVE